MEIRQPPPGQNPPEKGTPERGTPESGARPPGMRIGWLDALRGIAALVVVADHMVYTMDMFSPLRGLLSRWLALGQYGVFVFFLVSGYIIPVSLERKGSVRSFWVSRVFRLYPVYVLATVGLIALAAAGLGSLAGARHRPVSSVLGHLLMLSGLLGAPNVPYTVWTLSYEMVFYLLITALFVAHAHRRSDVCALGFGALTLLAAGVLPGAAFLDSVAARQVVDVAADILVLGGLALAVTRGGRLRVLGAGTAAATALALVALNRSPATPAWQALTILALMFTGTVVYRAEHRQISRRRAAGVVAAVFALAFGGLFWRAHLHGEAALRDLVLSQRIWLTSLALAGLTFLAGMALRRRRVPRARTWLGLVSYSVYLVHPLLLGVYKNVSWRPPGTPVARGLTIAVFLAVLLVISAMIYRFVESPAQRLGKQTARYLDTRFGGSPAR